MILTIKTDTAIAELALTDANGTSIAVKTWEAGRQLSQQLMPGIQTLLADQKLKLPDLTSVIVFRGPGSFTGLRIGITVANTLAYSLNISVVGAMGEDWAEVGRKDLATAKPAQVVMPEYGGEARITKPKK